MSMQLSDDQPSGSKPVFSKEQLKDMIKLITQVVDNRNTVEEEVVLEVPVDFSDTKAAESSEKIPDAVKCLREFSGKPHEFASWRKTVDRLLEMYQSYKNTPKYFAILHMIRHKIVGDADTALESYRIPLDWNKIKHCLMLHYSDKRDISTLEYQMTVMTQGNEPISVFYQKIYQHLSLILNKVDCLNLPEATLVSMANTYRDKALDTFIRGLNGDLPRLLSVKEPASLPQALHLCLKLDNMTFRMHHAHTSRPLVPPRLPPRPMQNRPLQSQTRQQYYPRQFYPELAHVSGNPQFMRNSIPNFVRYNTPWSAQNIQNPMRVQPQLPPKPMPKPIPMEVDETTRSAKVNYQNRPNYQYPQNSRPQFQNSNPAVKRQASNQNVAPYKHQRNYHVYTGE